jgi:hypothetical protein
MACIKTGVVLRKRNWDEYSGMWSGPGGHLETVYGDMHLVGNCCILYYPPHQVLWGASHGWIDIDDEQNMFQRPTLPQHILIIPASRIVMRKAALYYTDLDLFRQAGGTIDETPGEQG